MRERVLRFLACWYVLAAAPGHAAEPVHATMTYEAVTAKAPDGISRLRITPVEQGVFAVDFSIVAPNPSQHTGHIRGLATQQEEDLILRVPNFMEDGNLDHPALCTMVISAKDARARVVSAHQCAGFAGAGASFVEQGQDLRRR